MGCLLRGTSQDEDDIHDVLVREQVAPEGLEVLHGGLAVDRRAPRAGALRQRPRHGCDHPQLLACGALLPLTAEIQLHAGGGSHVGQLLEHGTLQITVEVLRAFLADGQCPRHGLQ